MFLQAQLAQLVHADDDEADVVGVLTCDPVPRLGTCDTLCFRVISSSWDSPALP